MTPRAPTALITGASSGLGAAFAARLAARGYSLLLSGRSEKALLAVQEQLSVPASIYPCDLSLPDACAALAARAKEAGVSLAINNAGAGLVGEFASLDGELLDAQTALNVCAVQTLTHALLTDFAARGEGYLLNVASAAAFLPTPLMASYAASKAFVLRLTQAVREELRRTHSPVVVSAFCPGPIETDFDRRAGASGPRKGIDPSFAAEYALTRLFRGKGFIVPTFSMKAARTVDHLLPDALLARISYHIQRKKL